MSALETPKDRQEAIEMIARVAVEYPHRVREIIEAAEKLGLRLVPSEETEEMAYEMFSVDADWQNTTQALSAVYRAAVAASPFAPEAMS